MGWPWGGQGDAKSRHLLIPNETLDLAPRGLVLGGEGDTKSRHLLSPKEALDLASHGLVLGGEGGAGRQI